jgi:hypothetical protein
MRIPIVLLALFVAALAVGCAGNDEVAMSTNTDPATATALEITLWPAGRDGEELRLGTLACDPPRGNARDPEAACAFLADGIPVLWQERGDQACTEIYGGPEEARIVGTVRGEGVEVELNRVNGCAIEVWDQSLPVLPDYAPVPPEDW